MSMTDTTDKCGHGAENCLNHNPFGDNRASDSLIVIHLREGNIRCFVLPRSMVVRTEVGGREGVPSGI